MSPLPLNKLSGMPQMQGAFAGWTSKITLDVRTQTVKDGIVCNIDKTVTFQGVIQPLSAKAISLKPEGQRAWQWLQIHCVSGSLNLDVNDLIVFNGIKYKIMAQNDYSLNGYIEYHSIYDYQP